MPSAPNSFTSFDTDFLVTAAVTHEHLAGCDIELENERGP
jgi:hypothetical protein